MYRTRPFTNTPSRARRRVASHRSVTTCGPRSVNTGIDQASPPSWRRMIPTRYRPSDVRCSSCHDARSTAIRWVVETGSPVIRAISVTE